MHAGTIQNYQGTTAFLEANVEVGFARCVGVGGTFGAGDAKWIDGREMNVSVRSCGCYSLYP